MAAMRLAAAAAAALSAPCLAAAAPPGAVAALEVALGGDAGAALGAAVRAEAPGFAEALRPTLAALPRSASGKLSAAGVRYSLHRMFARERGWHVAGLDPRGEAWNSTAWPPIAALDRAPAEARSRVERAISEEGLSEEEVAALAATIEHFIHADAAERLEAAFNVLGHPRDAPVSAQQAQRALELTLGSYMQGVDLRNASSHTALVMPSRMQAVYPNWPAVVKMIAGLSTESESKAAAAPQRSGGTGAVSTVGRLTDTFGPWQDSECTAMKGRLLQMEEDGTGRVRLADFHGHALDGNWQFGESTEYLRQLGALDETPRPGGPRVVIPNYIASLNNCILDSAYYSVCCISECEGLMLHVERAIMRPEASPEEIAAVVSALPSSTVPGNRTLSNVQLHRLHAIAHGHGGAVPLYGRLFAQWMHHAYPRECPFPHRAGTTRPELYDLWNVRGAAQIAQEEELAQSVQRKGAARPGAPVQAPAWSFEEELSGLEGPDDVRPPALWALVHLSAAAATMALVLLVLGRSTLRRLCGSAAAQGKPSSPPRRSVAREPRSTGPPALDV